MTEPAARKAPSLIGRTLGDYVIRAQLGEGGMGEVYRAEQLSLQREAVIKVMLVEERDKAISIQRFLREARLASSLMHPFAAHVYDFGVEPDGLMWIAMELVQGTPLNRLLGDRGAVPLPRLVPFMERLCEVVHAAHEQGIIHRDLKPANVMVLVHAGRYSPKLLDLGIAKRFGELYADSPLTPSAGGHRTVAALATPFLDRPMTYDVTMNLGAPSLPEPVGGHIPSPSPQMMTSEDVNLTSTQALIGTPAYAAPEVWKDPRLASPRSDIYALGIIVFEALTGRRPYNDRSALGLLKAHMGPVPLLGAGFAAPLQEVINRALARDVADRFSTALELGQALRRAAQLADDDQALPVLEEGLREVLLNEFPAPLAEAAAVLATARSVRTMASAVRGLAEATAWWLGLVGVIARVERVGPAFGADPIVKALLEAMHQRVLRAGEWLTLAQAAAEPYTATADTHPMPELVAFLTGEPELLSQLSALSVADVDAADLGHLQERMAKLERVLRRLGFLADYPLAVGRAGWVESWAGVRLRQRPQLSLARGVPVNEVAVLGGAGDVAMTLSPWVQALSPNPGAPDELFLLAGAGRHGAKLVAPPLDFERQDSQLFAELSRLGLEQRDAIDQTQASERAPYLGLASFSAADVDNFFGREREAEACANRLRLQGLLAIVGPSGAGKSSFVHAGVRPLLAGSQTFVAVRPGPTPLASLEARLVQQGFAAQGLRARVMAAPEALRDVLLAGPGPGTILFMDQFEEAVTLCGDSDERRALALGLHHASADATQPIRVILCMRDDFLMRLKQLPTLGDRLQGNLELIGTPSEDDLLRILSEPARRAGLTFDDATLATDMVQSVAQQPGALALLSFTALKLWELRDRKHGLLSRKAYVALGGVGGALAQHAESTLERMNERERALTREAFRHLVTSAGTRAVLRRSEMEQLLASQAVGAAVLERLIEARLLVTSEGAGGEDRVEVIHEALLASWPRLVQWQREDAEASRLRDQLRSTARQWDANGRPRGMLWRGDILAEYRLWRGRGSGALTQTEDDFARQSIVAEQRASRVLRSAILLAFLVLSTGLGIVFHLMQQARENMRTLYVDQGRTALLDHQPLRALGYLTHGQREGATGPMLEALLARSLQLSQGEEKRLRGAHGELWVAHLSPDQRFVLTGGEDGHARLFDLTGLLPARELTGHTGPVISGAFSPDSRLAATASIDGTAVLWDTLTGQKLRTLTHPKAVRHVAFSHDGRTVLTSGYDGLARQFRAADGALQHTYGTAGEALNFAWYSPDDRTVLAGGNDRVPRLYDAATEALEARLEGAKGPMRRAAFSADGKLVVASSEDHTVRTFEVATGRPRAVFSLHATNVTGLAFSPDGRWAASGSADGMMYVWSTDTAEVLFSLRLGGHVYAVAFSPDGRQLAVGSQDGSLTTLEVPTGQLRWRFLGQIEGVYDVEFSADGKHLLSAGLDGTARWWDAAHSLSRLTLPQLKAPGGSNAATWAVYSRDRKTILGAGGDRRVVAWAARTGELLHTWDGARATDFDRRRHGQVQPSPDGALLAVGHDAVVELRDADTFAVVRELHGLTGTVKSVAFGGNGARLAAASSNGEVTVWDVERGTAVWSHRQDKELNSVAFDPTGSRVLTAGIELLARVYDAATGRELLQIAQANSLESAIFSADGSRVLANGDDNAARAFDATTGQLVASLEGHSGPVNQSAYSPDGALIATAAEDGTVRLWDAATGNELDVLGEHRGPVYSVSFSEAGDELLTAGEDGEVRAWRLARASPPEVLGPALHCQVPFEMHGTQLVYRPVPGDCEQGVTQ